MTNDNNIDQFDNWFDDSGPAAMLLTEHLQSVTEGESVIFPPTYGPENPENEESKKPEYVIDILRDGQTICQIDSVGSQSNRMEPIFKQGPYDKLVPQVTIEVATGDKINLLDVGHRAADAIVRFSSLKDKLSAAFDAWIRGDASKLAEIAPTSLVFGAWDSRITHAKAPRIISSIIRAYDVEQLTRSAQYNPPVDYTPEILGEAANITKKQKSKLGLTHVPAPKALGGVLVHGRICREAILNLVVIRSLGVPDGKGGMNAEQTLSLRRYILGIALVALTKPMIHNLRQGCLLVGIENKPIDWKVVHHNGKREAFELSHHKALDYAQQAAGQFMDKFHVTSQIEGKFKPELVKEAADSSTEKKSIKKTKKNSDEKDKTAPDDSQTTSED
jgi:CRISPR-associated protein Csb1